MILNTHFLAHLIRAIKRDSIFVSTIIYRLCNIIVFVIFFFFPFWYLNQDDGLALICSYLSFGQMNKTKITNLRVIYSLTADCFWKKTHQHPYPYTTVGHTQPAEQALGGILITQHTLILCIFVCCTSYSDVKHRTVFVFFVCDFWNDVWKSVNNGFQKNVGVITIKKSFCY